MIFKFEEYIVEGYLDNEFDDVEVEKYMDGYLMEIDGKEFQVIFNMESDYWTFETLYYFIESDSRISFEQFEKNGVDPRKITLGFTKAIILFLKKEYPYKVYMENLYMDNEDKSKKSFNKRNNICFHYLKKMIPEEWKVERVIIKTTNFGRVEYKNYIIIKRELSKSEISNYGVKKERLNLPFKLYDEVIISEMR